MSRTAIPYVAADIAAVARSLRSQLEGRDQPPGHVELLNMLARAVGRRNYQHLKAQLAAQARLEAGPAPADAVDHERVERIARHFDRDGRLIRWPAKPSHQQHCLWALWAALPAGQTLTEQDVNAILKNRHLFADHAILRRALCSAGLVARTRDCREYRRIERRPPADAAALIRHVRAHAP